MVQFGAVCQRHAQQGDVVCHGCGDGRDQQQDAGDEEEEHTDPTREEKHQLDWLLQFEPSAGRWKDGTYQCVLRAMEKKDMVENLAGLLLDLTAGGEGLRC